MDKFNKIVVAQTLKIKPEILFIGRVAKSGNGAAIPFKKRFIGKEVYIIIKVS
jgi:putative transposon-encoded protein